MSLLGRSFEHFLLEEERRRFVEFLEASTRQSKGDSKDAAKNLRNRFCFCLVFFLIKSDT